MAKDAGQIRIADEVALHQSETAIARTLAVLIGTQDLDVGICRQRLLAAGHAVDHRGDLRPVLDDDVALVPDLVGQGGTGKAPRLHVVRSARVASAPAALTSTATTGMPAACARLIAGRIALGSTPLIRIRLAPAATKLSTCVNCFVQVVVGRCRVHADVRRHAARGVCRTFGEGHEIGIAQRSERDAQTLELFRLGDTSEKSGADRQRCRKPLGVLHVNVSPKILRC